MKQSQTSYTCTDIALEEANRVRYEKRYGESAKGHFSGNGNAEYASPQNLQQELEVHSFVFSNIHGGTVLVRGRVKARIEGKWWDEETGWHYMGRVLAIVEPCIDSFEKKPCVVSSYIFFGEFDV